MADLAASPSRAPRRTTTKPSSRNSSSPRCSGAIVAFLVGVYIATELAWPQFNLGLSFMNFGRLRPVHTSAAIFAFGGSALFATSFYVVQRTCRARLFGGEALANFVFWGYQFFIVMAALSYVIGLQPEPGIRRARVAHRHVADRRLGRLRWSSSSAR